MPRYMAPTIVAVSKQKVEEETGNVNISEQLR